MPSHTGYARLWRKTLQSAVWDLSPLAWRVWCWLLMSASHAHRKVKVPGGEVVIHPGEIVTTYSAIVKGVQWTDNKGVAEPTPRQVRYCLDSLSNLNMVERRQEPRQTFLLLSVCNWDTYQGDHVSPVVRTVSEPCQDRVRVVSGSEPVDNPGVVKCVQAYLTRHDTLGRTRPTARTVGQFTDRVRELLDNGADPALLQQAAEALVTKGKPAGFLEGELGEMEKQRRGGPAPKAEIRPQDRAVRVARAAQALKDGIDPDLCRGFCLDEDEWNDAKKNGGAP